MAIQYALYDHRRLELRRTEYASIRWPTGYREAAVYGKHQQEARFHLPDSNIEQKRPTKQKRRFWR